MHRICEEGGEAVLTPVVGVLESARNCTAPRRKKAMLVQQSTDQKAKLNDVRTADCMIREMTRAVEGNTLVQTANKCRGGAREAGL